MRLLAAATWSSRKGLTGVYQPMISSLVTAIPEYFTCLLIMGGSDSPHCAKCI